MNNKQLADKLEQWADALAESGGQKWVLSVPVREDVDPDCLMIEAAKRLRLAPIAEPVGMRWVKASERLPEKEGYYCCRISGGYMGLRLVDIGAYKRFEAHNRHVVKRSTIEWLDDSSTPSAREAELEREVAVLKTQVRAYKTLQETGDKIRSYYMQKAEDGNTAISTLNSEREANAILTEEVESLKSQLHAVYEGADQWKQECNDARSLLQQLWELKVVKNREGKTEAYQQRQPKVWEKVEKFLSKYQHQ